MLLGLKKKIYSYLHLLEQILSSTKTFLCLHVSLFLMYTPSPFRHLKPKLLLGNKWGIASTNELPLCMSLFLFSISFDLTFAQAMLSMVYTEWWRFTITFIVVTFLITKCLGKKSILRKDWASRSKGYGPWCWEGLAAGEGKSVHIVAADGEKREMNIGAQLVSSPFLTYLVCDTFQDKYFSH